MLGGPSTRPSAEREWHAPPSLARWSFTAPANLTRNQHGAYDTPLLPRPSSSSPSFWAEMAWVSLFVDILTDRSGRLSAACSVVCLAPPRLGVLGEMGSVEWDGAESWETSARNGKYVQHPAGIGMGLGCCMGMVHTLGEVCVLIHDGSLGAQGLLVYVQDHSE